MPGTEHDGHTGTQAIAATAPLGPELFSTNRGRACMRHVAAVKVHTSNSRYVLRHGHECTIENSPLSLVRLPAFSIFPHSKHRVRPTLLTSFTPITPCAAPSAGAEIIAAVK